MRRSHAILIAVLAFLFLTGCRLSLLGWPKLFPTAILPASPTPLSTTPVPVASDTPGLPSATPTLESADRYPDPEFCRPSHPPQPIPRRPARSYPLRLPGVFRLVQPPGHTRSFKLSRVMC